MKSFPRHAIVPAQFIEEDLDNYASGLETKLSNLAARPVESVGAMQNDFYDAVAFAIAAGRPHAEVLKYLLLYKSLTLANFRVGAGKAVFEADFEETAIAFPSQPKTDFMSVDDWTNAYDACMIMRDEKGLKFLATVSEEVFTDSNNGTSAFDLAYFRFLAHFFKGGQDTGKWIEDVVAEANKPQDNKVRQDFVDQVRYPELMLYKAFLLNDAAAFNTALYEALEAHQKFFGKKANANNTTGWVSFPILCACVMASDSKKFPIEVESDYIPRWLILGEGIIR